MIADKREVKTERLRAIVEISGGEVIVLPIADSDGEREKILDALRIYFRETKGQSHK